MIPEGTGDRFCYSEPIPIDAKGLGCKTTALSHTGLWCETINLTNVVFFFPQSTHKSSLLLFRKHIGTHLLFCPRDILNFLLPVTE